MKPPITQPGPRLALAQDAVREALDMPQPIDWFGVVTALTQAHADDILSGDFIPTTGEPHD